MNDREIQFFLQLAAEMQPILVFFLTMHRYQLNRRKIMPIYPCTSDRQGIKWLSLPFLLPCQGHFKPSQLAASFSGMDLNGAHQEVSTVTTLMLKCWTMSVKHLSFAFTLIFLFSCGTFVQYFVYLVLKVFSRLINHNNRKKTSAYIHHTALVTFP